MLKGIAASPGIAIGRSLVLRAPVLSFSTIPLNPDKIQEEVARFRRAVTKSREQLTRIKERVDRELGQEKGNIFSSHLLFLDDPALIDEVIGQIETCHINAEPVLEEVITSFAGMFEGMEDPYMRERAADIRDVGRRLLANLSGVEITSLADLTEEVVVVGDDLTPSDMAQLDREKVLGIATNTGGPTSHTAIMARFLEIPAVVGLGQVLEKVKTADMVVVDGSNGYVFINPPSEKLVFFEKAYQDCVVEREELKKLKDLPSETMDGHRVELAANIGKPKDLPRVLTWGADGIGLYRTEFLYLDRSDLPGEEEQFTSYKIVVEQMAGKPVIIRTLDIGGDKKLPYLSMPQELNPFLGWRGIRFCLDRPDVFKTQLRAILRASAFGKIRIMYPMISDITELREANNLVAQCKNELRAEGHSFDENVQIGIMVEIPSVAIVADIFAREVDFFSIGTNDLIQYTMAVDRLNDQISHLYQPYQPAVLRLIENVIAASHRAGIWTGLCGEMAGDVLAAPVLLGMGLDEFSMNPASITRVKKVIRSLTRESAHRIKENAINMTTAKQVREYLTGIADEMTLQID